MIIPARCYWVTRRILAVLASEREKGSEEAYCYKAELGRAEERTVCAALAEKG